MQKIWTFLLLCLPLTMAMPAQASVTEKSIAIAPMEPFSGRTRDEILEKRRQAVQKSIFNDILGYYYPNTDVYQIESGLPWIGAHDITCNGHGTTGDSRESFGILNPAVLYYPLMAAYHFSKTTGCSVADYLLVYKLTYDEDRNLITAHIDYSSFYKKNKVYYRIHLSDTNARDLGYNYAFATKVRNIRFAEDHNLASDIVPTRGFFHRGGSCGVPGGCNNYSPKQSELEFYINSLPAELYIKLWKTRPLYKEDPADITYRLIFD